MACRDDLDAESSSLDVGQLQQTATGPYQSRFTPRLTGNVLNQNVFDLMSRRCRNAAKAMLRDLLGQNPGKSQAGLSEPGRRQMLWHDAFGF